MRTIFVNTEKCKTNEPHKLVLKLSPRLDLRSLNKHFACKTCLFIHLENIRQQYKNNKRKIIAPTWNDEFD